MGPVPTDLSSLPRVLSTLQSSSSVFIWDSSGGLWLSVPQQGRSEWAGFPGNPRVIASMNWARCHSFLPLFVCVKCLRHPSLHLQGQQLLVEGHHLYMRAPWEVASCVLRGPSWPCWLGLPASKQKSCFVILIC